MLPRGRATSVLQAKAAEGARQKTDRDCGRVNLHYGVKTRTTAFFACEPCPMKIVNHNELKEEYWASPKGTYVTGDKQISIALGRVPASSDLNERHPFDVDICRIPAGKTACPYHSHSAQWEFYHVISGTGKIRHHEGVSSIGPGDAFIFKPDEPHQVINDSADDLVVYIVADNPIGESGYYPDSGKWIVRSPERRLIRSAPVDYFDGEE